MLLRLILCVLVGMACYRAGHSCNLLAKDEFPPAKETRQAELAKTAPTPLRGLMERGNVTIKFVPAADLPAEEWGRCEFTLSSHRNFEFDAKTKLKGGERIATVKVTSMKHEVRIVHEIRLREAFAPPRTWDSAVTWHEFDHVAIGCDPRPVLLLAYLVEHLPVIERPLIRRDEAMLPTLAAEWINDELAKREKAVTELIRQNNRLLDLTSRHGIDVIQDRRGFFAKLYSKEHLAEMKFPYLDEALGVFEQDAYRRAESAAWEQMPTRP